MKTARPPSGRERALRAERRGLWNVLCLIALILAAVGAAGCRRTDAYPPPPVVPTSGEGEVGLASWYGHPYHGRTTANGETYDMYEMTAAHRTLAFDTWVRVVNLENNLVTVVRINDRGPFIDGRIIDLSRKGAEQIEMVGPGTALVRVEIIERPEAAAASPARFSVQVGAFLIAENARRLKSSLDRKFDGVYVDSVEVNTALYHRVRVGKHSTREAAEAVAVRLRRHAEVGSAMVVSLN